MNLNTLHACSNEKITNDGIRCMNLHRLFASRDKK